jgi:hypothetical protein
VGISLEQELKSTLDELEKIKKVEEDLNASINESGKLAEEWVLSNREILTLLRTFYYRNTRIEGCYHDYYYSILDYLRNNSDKAAVEATNNTQSLIEIIREETFKGPFQRFLESMKDKIKFQMTMKNKRNNGHDRKK